MREALVKELKSCVTSECMRKLMIVKALQRLLLSTRSGLTQSQHLRRSPCKSDHEKLQENSIVKVDQICSVAIWAREQAQMEVTATLGLFSRRCHHEHLRYQSNYGSSLRLRRLPSQQLLPRSQQNRKTLDCWVVCGSRARTWVLQERSKTRGLC